MKAADIEVGAVYRMRWEPKVRLTEARVIARDGNYFAVEVVTVEREPDSFSGCSEPLEFGPQMFEERIA